MKEQFEANNNELLLILKSWEPELSSLSEEIICNRRNKQGRNIKQILGHLVDSATNNTHRIIHLQYQQSPVNYPDYANLGNNDRWIAIQNYEQKNWKDLIQLWKYSNLHIVHVIQNVKEEKLENVWISALKEEIKLKDMIINYLKHFKLHITEIEDLIHSEN